MIKKQLLFLVCNLIFITSSLNADSLWSQSKAASMFDNQRSFKVGDLITVKISAESTAVQEAEQPLSDQTLELNFLIHLINMRWTQTEMNH